MGSFGRHGVNRAGSPAGKSDGHQDLNELCFWLGNTCGNEYVISSSPSIRSWAVSYVCSPQVNVYAPVANITRPAFSGRIQRVTICSLYSCSTSPLWKENSNLESFANHIIMSWY